MGLEKRDTKKYLGILSDGSIRMAVPEGTEGAVKRTYERSDKTSSYKWELVYDSLTGYITNVEFYEGDYGKVMHVYVEDNEEFVLTMGVESSFCEDLMRKLPNVDFNKQVKLVPYSFTDERDKARRGITVYQGDQKLNNYFYNADTKEYLNGMPVPQGDKEQFEKDDWKMYYMTVRKFLITHTLENIVPKISSAVREKPASEGQNKPVSGGYEYPEEYIDLNSVPF